MYLSVSVVEGEDGQTDVLVCNDSTTYVNNEDLSMRGKKINSKGKRKWKVGFGEEGRIGYDKSRCQ